MSKLLVVIGITGKQVRYVSSGFEEVPTSSDREVQLLKSTPKNPAGETEISRNLDKAQSWKEKGVEVVKGDLDDSASLVAAFKGANAIFSTTDFWGPFYNPATQKHLKNGQTINNYCYELELQQGKNIAHISALCDASKWSKGKYTGNYNFDSKARIVDYIREGYPPLAAKMSVVQIGSYMDNWKSGPMFSKHEDAFHLSMVGSGKRPIPHFNTERDCGYVVPAALQAAPGRNILGVGSMLSWTEYLKIWCNINNVPFGGVDSISLEVFEKAVLMPGLGSELGEMLAFMDEFGYDGGDPTIIHAADLGVPCPMTTWEAYVKEQDWSSILSN